MTAKDLASLLNARRINSSYSKKRSTPSSWRPTRKDDDDDSDL
jgi:hypothetical protein